MISRDPMRATCVGHWGSRREAYVFGGGGFPGLYCVLLLMSFWGLTPAMLLMAVLVLCWKMFPITW